ncbi:MAG: DDE-type integrase/transposase/recombinase [Deltaproteobacteria bacterium]|nr:DDE-type integrase/transposase/recombinase [Deltaproteobacteria bacterium]
MAIIDWASWKVLSWCLFNTLEDDFCVETLREALARFPNPRIFNADKGAQFTSNEFTQVLKEAGIRISMGGKGCWMETS